jgi:hypothetical protein
MGAKGVREVTDTTTLPDLSPHDARQRRYSIGMRLAALQNLQAGDSIRQVAHTFGMSTGIVHNLKLDPEMIELIDPRIVELRKKHIGGVFLRMSDLCLTELSHRNLDKCPPQQLAWMAAVFYDKWRLATGQSTENLNVHSISANLAVELDKLAEMRQKLLGQDQAVA